MTRNAWNMRRWWENRPRTGVDPASGFLGLCQDPVPPAQDQDPQVAWPDDTPQLADATPREEKTVGELTLNDRGRAVEVQSYGLTVRGILQDFRAEGVTEWDGSGRDPDILPGPVTLDITGARQYTAAIVTCWPTDPIRIIPRRT